MTDSDNTALAAALIELARYGITPDILDLLVRGDLDLKVPPGALAAALKAANAELQAEIEALKHDVERHVRIAADLASESITREKEAVSEPSPLYQTLDDNVKTEPEIRGRPIPPGSIKTGPIPDFSEELRQMRETWQAVGGLDRQIRGQERNHSWLGRFKSFWREISP